MSKCSNIFLIVMALIAAPLHPFTIRNKSEKDLKLRGLFYPQTPDNKIRPSFTNLRPEDERDLLIFHNDSYGELENVQQKEVDSRVLVKKYGIKEAMYTLYGFDIKEDVRKGRSKKFYLPTDYSYEELASPLIVFEIEPDLSVRVIKERPEEIKTSSSSSMPAIPLQVLKIKNNSKRTLGIWGWYLVNAPDRYNREEQREAIRNGLLIIADGEQQELSGTDLQEEKGNQFRRITGLEIVDPSNPKNVLKGKGISASDLELRDLTFEIQPDFSISSSSSSSSVERKTAALPSSSSRPVPSDESMTVSAKVPTVTPAERKVEVARARAVSFPGLKKINDDLYVGKVADKFYLAMERVTPETVGDWLRYAKRQVVAGERVNFKSLPSLDGSQHFQLVLEEYKSNVIHQKANELWIAYASDIPVTKRAELNTDEGDENPHIEMFVTAITSPDALITSHMGISRTWEGALGLDRTPPTRKKHPDQSLHLHSFAAKVMKLKDPRKVYMLTAPATAMRDIIIKKMPAGSVFVGDSLYQNRLEAAEKDRSILLSPYDLKERKNESADKRQERLKKEAQSKYDYYKIPERISLLKSNPPRIIRTRDGMQQTFTLQNPDASPLVTFDQSSPIYQWMFTRAYQDMVLHLPYILVDLDTLAQFGGLIAE